MLRKQKSMPIKEIDKIIHAAFCEDHVYKDVTTNALIPRDYIVRARIILKQKAVVCGVDIVKRIFKILDPRVIVQLKAKNSKLLTKGAELITLKGPARSILAGERVALNFLGHLSGIATITRNFVDAVYPNKVKILDTRKTTPGWRALEKYAVVAGGGSNHRHDLKEMILIKDNHRMICGKQGFSIKDIIKKSRKRSRKKLEIEVDNFNEFKEAIEAGPDVILLDNMTVAQVQKIVKYNNSFHKNKKKQTLLEVSGNINIKNVKKMADTGIDFISIGVLTHTKQNVDISMEVSNE